MKTKQRDPWEAFKASENPLAKIRELKAGLPQGPGVRSMYEEAGRTGTVMGVPVLRIGKNIYVPRQRIIERVEGR